MNFFDGIVVLLIVIGASYYLYRSYSGAKTEAGGCECSGECVNCKCSKIPNVELEGGKQLEA